MVDQIRIDHILQIAPPIVRQQHIDRFTLIVAAAAALAGDGVVDAVDDARTLRKHLVCLNLLHGLGDRLGAEGAADLFEGEELRVGRVLDEVDVREAALFCKGGVVSLCCCVGGLCLGFDVPRLGVAGS